MVASHVTCVTHVRSLRSFTDLLHKDWFEIPKRLFSCSFVFSSSIVAWAVYAIIYSIFGT